MKASVNGLWWRVLTLLAVISMLLAACGGTGGQQNTQTAAGGAAATTAAGAGAAATTGAAGTEATTAAGTEETATTAAGGDTDETATAAGGDTDETATAAGGDTDETATAGAGTAGTTTAGGGTTGTATAGGRTTGTATAGGGTTGTATAGGGTTGAAGGAESTFALNPDVSGTVDLWHFWGSPVRRTAIRRVVAICQQQLPNIQITETFKPFGDLYTAHIAAVAAGSGMADVIVEDRPQLPQRAVDGIDMNLQEFADRDGIDGSAFWPFTWQETLYEGDTYGIPYETDVRVLYYNKNAFEEVGLDPEKPPTTWAELEQYADKLDKKAADGSFERIGFSPLIGNVGPDVWARTNGWEPVTDGKVNVNTPEMQEAVEWVRTWMDRYGGFQAHQDFRADLGAAPNDAFMSGKVAMLVDINGYSSQLNFFRPRVPTAEEGKTEELRWGVSDIPYNTEQASTSGGFALSIPTGSRNAEAAWEFIKCATSQEAQSSWGRDTYAMPANLSAANDPVLLADPNWQFFLNAMEYSTGATFVPEYANWGQELGNRYEAVWTGETEPAAMLQEAQEAIDAEIGQ
ncbi:MAG TPA: ABC transporter substrate-binding protein [Herpetosiphonaceae bacterium]|nr:ABC transporter substrate-binding protein [Herpetosiphonaceae bacterium]